MNIFNRIRIALDRKKVDNLEKSGKMTAGEIAEARIVFICWCGMENNIKRTKCIRCGKDIS